MKSEFSKTWNKSKQPRKQRKYLANAPIHLKRKLLCATLEKSLRSKNKRKSIELRKNDEVKVMRGKYTKKQGKIIVVDIKNTRVQIDGINLKKKDGEKAPIWFHPSNLKIIKLDDSDKRRIKEKKTELKKESKEEVIKSKPKEKIIKKETKLKQNKEE
jgi:large subunit ribosomal protein L24